VNKQGSKAVVSRLLHELYAVICYTSNAQSYVTRAMRSHMLHEQCAVICYTSNAQS